MIVVEWARLKPQNRVVLSSIRVKVATLQHVYVCECVCVGGGGRVIFFIY